MIAANVVRAVQDLLRDRGIEQKPDEQLGDYVARGLNVSEAQASALLEYLHDGATLEEAQARAGTEVEPAQQVLLIEIARAIGSALGRIAR
jgi:hypothetical protein